MKAFPIVVPKENFQYADEGMDLRDYFAAKAMQAIISDPEAFFGRDDYYEKIAEFSYKQADAMIEARK